MPENILYISKLNDRVLLTVDHEWSEWWLLYPHPKDPRYFVVETRQFRDFMLWAKKISYSEMGVQSFKEILLGLLLHTKTYMKKFTGKDIDIMGIIIEGDAVEVNNFPLDVFSYNKPKYISGDAVNVEIGIVKRDDGFEVTVVDLSDRKQYPFNIKRGTGTGDICELFKGVLLNPRPVIEGLLGKKVFITRITISNESRVNTSGFGNCDIIKGFDIPFIEKILGNFDRVFDEEINHLMFTEWTLVIEEYGNKEFMLYLKDDPEKRAWVIEPHKEDDVLFILSFIRGGYEVVSVVRKYYDYGSGNIEDLIKKIAENPQIMLGALTNVSARVTNVEFIKTEKFKYTVNPFMRRGEGFGKR
jgi:hypothetical protein